VALTVAQLVARVTADTSGFYRSMAIMNSSMIRTGGVASRIFAGIGLATTGIGILSLRAAGNFEQSMNILQAVSGATEAQMKSLGDEAIALGGDFKLPNVSAKDAADAMVELSKGGLGVNRTLAATRGTLQLGLAANIGFADSATLVARALQAFDMQGSQSTRVANLFAAGANKSTAEITDLALGMQNAAAQFHGVGMPMEDLVASLSVLADNALSGEYAGTALKTMLIRLTSPTDKAAAVMKKYNMEIFDSAGNMKSMPAIIGEFQDGLSNLTQEQREQALTTIFGVRANQAMRILMGEGAEAYKKYRKEITGTNAAQKMAEARTKGLNGALGAVGSAAETLAIQLGTAMLPSVTAVVRAFANFIAAIDPQKIIGFFSAIKGGVVWVIELVRGSDLLQYALVALAGALTGMFVMTKIIAMVQAMKIAMLALNATMLMNPFVLAAAALVALGAAFFLAYQKSETFRKIVDSTFSWIKENVLPIIMEVVDAIRTHWGSIVEIVQTYLSLVRLYWEQTFGRILNFAIQNWDKIRSVIEAVLGNILILVKGYMTYVEGVINLVMGIIKGDWGRAWEGIKQIVDGILGTIIRLIWNTLTKLVPAVLGLAVAIGKAILTGIGNGIASLAGWLWDKIKSGTASAIASVVGWVGGAAAAIGRAIADGIISGIAGLPGRLAGAVKGAAQSALDSATSFLGIGSPSKLFADKIGKPIGDGIIMGFLLGTNDLPDKISESLKKALEAGRQVVEEFQSKFKDAFAQMASDALDAFDAITSAHRTRSERLLDNLVSKHDAEEFKRRLSEARTELQKAKDDMASFDAASFSSPEDAQAELDRRESALLNAQRSWDDLMYEQKRAKLERQAEKERTNYEARRGIQKRHLEKELENLMEYLLKHPQQHKKTQDKIIALLHSYGISYRDAGSVVGENFAQGLRDSMAAVIAAATEMANKVSRILRTASPTKEGPMSDLDKWWKSFGSTLVSGLDKSPVERAALALAGAMQPTAGGGYALAGSGTSTTGSMAPIVHQHIYGSLIYEQDLNDRIREAIIVEERRGRPVH